MIHKPQTQSLVNQSKPVSSQPTINQLGNTEINKSNLGIYSTDLFSIPTPPMQRLWTETYGVEFSRPNALSDAQVYQSNEDMITIKSTDGILSGATMKGYEVQFYVGQGLSNHHGNSTRIHIFCAERNRKIQCIFYSNNKTMYYRCSLHTLCLLSHVWMVLNYNI